jgi:hypothetical protein
VPTATVSEDLGGGADGQLPPRSERQGRGAFRRRVDRGVPRERLRADLRVHPERRAHRRH